MVHYRYYNIELNLYPSAFYPAVFIGLLYAVWRLQEQTADQTREPFCFSYSVQLYTWMCRFVDRSHHSTIATVVAGNAAGFNRPFPTRTARQAEDLTIENCVMLITNRVLLVQEAVDGQGAKSAAVVAAARGWRDRDLTNPFR